MQRTSCCVIFALVLSAADADTTDCPTPQMLYPRLANQAGIEGKVTARVSPKSRDNKHEIELVEGHPLLRKEVVEKLPHWALRQREGEAVTKVIAEFRLHGSCLAPGVCTQTCEVDQTTKETIVRITAERVLADHGMDRQH